jgi:type I restriction enzyme S subunit
MGATLDRVVSVRTAAEFPVQAKRLRNNFDLLFDTPTTIPHLRQTILQLAVQGQLVPQAPSDESADRETCVEDYLIIQNGYAFKSEWFVPDGVRLVRNVNIGHGELRWDDLACVSEERAHEFTRFELNEGDIVIALDRPLISTGLKVARLTKADLPALLLQRVGRPQFKDSSVVPEYFFLWLNSPAFTGSIDPGKSNGVPHIATKDVHRIRFAPPSPKTQKRIVSKVTELLSLCDALEAKLMQAESASTQLLSAAVHHMLTKLE